MELLMLFLCVISTIVTSISVSSNGNSPEVKMLGGMMVDVQKGFVPMIPKPVESTTKSNYDKSRKLNADAKLSLNERYRRLIPYMTFYYANDLASTTEAYSTSDVEVEKAEIVEARTLQQRQPKKIIYSPNRNIPRYQGNRLTQFNIASANPVKVYYRDGVPVYQNSVKVTPNHNPLVPEHITFNNHDFDHGRFIQKQIVKSPSAPFTPVTRKPQFSNYYPNEDLADVQYYLSEKEEVPKFKLIPYQQAPPVKIVPQSESIYETKRPVAVPVLIPKEPVYIKPRPARPQYIYDNIQPVNARKIPIVVSENYYEKRRPAPALPQPIVQPVIENGFRPIIRPVVNTEAPVYTTVLPTTSLPQYESAEKPEEQIVENAPITPEVTNYRPNYYQYVVEQPAYKPEEYVLDKTVTLSDLLNSLQLNKSIPKPITRENVGSSIRTLLQVLNALKTMSQQNDVEVPPVLSTPQPFIATKVVQMTPKSVAGVTPPVDDVDLHEEQYLAPVNPPSQHLDDFPTSGGTSQQFPPPVHSDTEGGTPGRPGVDYPVLTTIPPTSFDCKTQRYKGFFADPDTRCQVWHYCDLNGGQASFLCPNGTIFSQAALTCDWWFNVRCATTTQLYVLNESLYKYILPHSPKFPEDYSGPLVDKYLTLKFKEMEEQFKKNKNKQSAAEKIDSDETEETSEDGGKNEESTSEQSEESEVSTVSEASVLVESPGASGNVERLQD